MNSDDLSLFSLVVAEGSISAAAFKLGCDASTISRRISHLEKSCGTRLFGRSGRGVELSPQGAILLNFAQQVTTLIEEAQAAMSNTTGKGPTRVRIAAQPTIAKVMFSPLFEAIHARYPTTQIHFIEGLANKILIDLQSGDIDIAILYKPEYPGALVFEPLLFEQLYVLVPFDSEITAEQVRTTGLAGIPLVLPSTAHGLRVLVEAMALRRGYVPNIVLETDTSIATTLELVSKGYGCTLKPLASAEAHVAAGHLRAIPLEGVDGERCVSLVLGKTRMAPNDLWALNAIIRKLTMELVESRAWSGTRLA